MREKLRNFFGSDKDAAKGEVKTKSKKDFEDLVKKFYKESTEFLEGGQNDLPMPLDHYRDVFASAYDFIKENPKEVDTLRNEYVTFSENLLKYISSKGDAINTKEFFYSNVLDVQ